MKLKRVIKNGSPMWLADLGVWRGKRERLFRASKEEAQALMAARKKEMRELGERGLPIRQSEMASILAAYDLAKKHGRTLLHCVQQAIHIPQTEEMRLSLAIAECIAAKTSSGKRYAYTRKFSSHLNAFKIGLEDHKCHEVTRGQIEAWAWKGEKKKVQPISARSRIIDVGTFFSFCIKRRWCINNPAKEIEPIMLEDKPPGIHTIEQAQALMKSCLEHPDGRKVICYVALGYFAGLRPAEILRLKPDDIQDGFVNIEGPKAKTRLRRLIPINDTLRAWLEISSVPKCKNFHRNFDRVRAVVPWSHDVLRHSFCSYALPKYGATKTAEYAGHSEQILFAHYRERVKPDDAEAYWKILP